MLTKKYRLRKNFQFNYVYKKGTAVPGKFFILFYCPRRNKGINIGFSVSNKLGKAVERNKIKRRLREAVRISIPNMPDGYNYVFMARNPIKDTDYANICKAVCDTLNRVAKKAVSK